MRAFSSTDRSAPIMFRVRAQVDRKIAKVKLRAAWVLNPNNASDEDLTHNPR